MFLLCPEDPGPGTRPLATIRKESIVENVADLGTKELSREKLVQFLHVCGMEFAAGRHPRALKAQLDQGAKA